MSELIAQYFLIAVGGSALLWTERRLALRYERWSMAVGLAAFMAGIVWMVA